MRGNAEQENNAIFHQAMCVLHGEEYKSPEKDTVIDDLYDVLIYLDFRVFLTAMPSVRNTPTGRKRPSHCFVPRASRSTSGTVRTAILPSSARAT